MDGALTGTTTLALRGTQQGQAFTIEQGELVNPQASVRAQGRYAPQDTNLTAQIGVADLGAFGMGWKGALNADASFVDDVARVLGERRRLVHDPGRSTR